MSAHDDIASAAARGEAISTREAFDRALDALLCAAAREIRLFDAGLDARFATAGRMDILRRLLRRDARSRVRIVLHETGNLARDCPRLLLLQRQFSDRFAIHRTEAPARSATDPLVLADQSACLHRFHYNQPRAALLLDALQAIAPLSARFEEIWEASAPAATGHVLGL